VLDWQVGEGEIPDFHEDERPRRRWQPPRWLWMGTLGVLVLAGLSTAAYFFLGVRSGEAQARTEIQQAADLEIWARTNDNRVVFFESLDPTAAREWRTRQVQTWREGQEWRAGAEVIHAELYENLAWVELQLTNKQGKLYREGRFYRRGADGRWRRSPGDEAFWGPMRVAETQYFQIQHRLRDAPYVRQATEGLDAWYTQLRADFGLPAPKGQRVVDVVAEPEIAASGNVVLKSPLLDLRTSDDTPANVLRGWLALKLAEELIQEIAPAQAQSARSSAHRTLLTGIVYWEVNQFAPFTKSEQTELRSILTEAVTRNSLIPLRELLPAYSDEARQRLLWPHQVSVAFFTADTYGRASFAKLIRQTPESLERTIPGALSVPYEQFEADWRRYVQQNYTG
jgi:hypothetical protein